MLSGDINDGKQLRSMVGRVGLRQKKEAMRKKTKALLN